MAILLAMLFGVWVAKYDNVYATNNYIKGEIISAYQSNTKSNRVYRAHIKLENGQELRRNVSELDKTGSEITFRIYKSKVTGRIEYVHE